VAKPGRPKGSGYPEDEPILREMVRALLAKEVSSNYAAAREFADRVPGGSLAARQRRLYDKIRKRRADLEKEITAEEPDGDDADGQELRALIDLAMDVAKESSFEAKLASLAHVFRPAAETEALREGLIEYLRESGLELSDSLKEKLDISLYYYRSISKTGAFYSELQKVHKSQTVKKLRAVRTKSFPPSAEGKKPDTGS